MRGANECARSRRSEKQDCDLAAIAALLHFSIGSRSATSPEKALDQGSQEGSYRWRAEGFAQHRKRLGLSAADAGKLLGVSGLTVYKWEGGQAHSREVSAGDCGSSLHGQARSSQTAPVDDSLTATTVSGACASGASTPAETPRWKWTCRAANLYETAAHAATVRQRDTHPPESGQLRARGLCRPCPRKNS
jgi:hypothetical protein